MNKQFLFILAGLLTNIFSNSAESNEKSLHPVYYLIPQFRISPYSVLVEKLGEEKSEWMFWHDAYDQKLVSKIIDFNEINSLFEHLLGQEPEPSSLHLQLLLHPKSINKIDTKYFSEFWRRQTIRSAIKGKSEPKYIEIISNLLSDRIRIFSEKRQETIKTKSEFTRHAYCLLLTIISYTSLVDSAQCRAASDNGGSPNYITDFTVSDPRRFWYPYDSAYRYAHQILWCAVLEAGSLSASDSRWMYTYKEALDSGLSAIYSTYFEEVYVAAHNASRAAVNDFAEQGKTSDQRERVSFLFAQKVALLYMLVNFEDIFKKAYAAIIANMPNKPNINIFSSSRAWHEFQENHSLTWILDRRKGKYVETYIRLWISELNIIASTIEKMPDES